MLLLVVVVDMNVEMKDESPEEELVPSSMRVTTRLC